MAEADGVWHQYVLDSGLGVAVKLAEQDGRFVVTEMYLRGNPRISASDLRTVQPARFEALGSVGGGDFERMAADHRREHGESEPTLAELRMTFEMIAPAVGAARSVPQREPLTRPDGTDPDRFYRTVAEVYREYLKTTKAPAAAIAAEADVPVGTVYRWLREARARKFLPPGEKGRAG